MASRAWFAMRNSTAVKSLRGVHREAHCSFGSLIVFSLLASVVAVADCGQPCRSRILRRYIWATLSSTSATDSRHYRARIKLETMCSLTKGRGWPHATHAGYCEALTGA